MNGGGPQRNYRTRIRAVQDRARCEDGNLRSRKGTVVQSNFVNASREVAGDMTNLDSNRRSDRLNGICFILGYEQPIHIELHQAISEDGDRMMPRPVVVGERT